jgi:hypothetical protein
MLIPVDTNVKKIKVLLCPAKLNKEDSNYLKQCNFDECLAWRWYDLVPDENGCRRGYCGLAGKPEVF